MRYVLLLVAALLPACGTGSESFQIDNVVLSPSDIPVASTSGTPLVLSCDAIDGFHNVLRVWATSPSAPIWINLGASSTYPHWSGSLPLSAFSGFTAGQYPLDLHAYDDGDMQVDLSGAVTLLIE